MPGHSLPEDCSTLDQAEEGMMVEIMMSAEELEDSEELLKILHTQQLIPGAEASSDFSCRRDEFNDPPAGRTTGYPPLPRCRQNPCGSGRRLT